MDPRHLYYDDRHKMCAYCGAPPQDHDHVPSKVLLDRPFPPDLPTVPACKRCNNGFSADEPYLACVVECAVYGSTDPNELRRDKVIELLTENAALARDVAKAAVRNPNGSIVGFTPEEGRVHPILMKLARGHVAFVCGELALEAPRSVRMWTIDSMTEAERMSFEQPTTPEVWPEIGSRAFCESYVVDTTPSPASGWRVVQDGRYRFMVSWADTLTVRCVMSEYLACEVKW